MTDSSAADAALRHVRHLAEVVGPRGGSTPKVREAAEYAASELRRLGARDVGLEPFLGATSTYHPYALALGTAMVSGCLAALVGGRGRGGRGALALGCLLSGLGVAGFLAEADLEPGWTRPLLTRRVTVNAVGRLPARRAARRRVVLCAHLDTHRTPLAYSSPTWHRLFGTLVAGSLASMALGALAFGLGGLIGWAPMRWAAALVLPAEAASLALCLQADLTPYSPGANDDASGVGVALALAERLAAAPLEETEVWVALTDDEECGAHGIRAFLDAHEAELGADAVYVVLDMVGQGHMAYLADDGLVLKHPTHPRALDLARRVSARRPDLRVREGPGLAYTDALVATKRGLVALTVCCYLPEGSGEVSHWHQVSDTVEHVDPRALGEAAEFAWELLRLVDASAPAGSEAPG